MNENLMAQDQNEGQLPIENKRQIGSVDFNDMEFREKIGKGFFGSLFHGKYQGKTT